MYDILVYFNIENDKDLYVFMQVNKRIYVKYKNEGKKN